jgi:hypothetical protein
VAELADLLCLGAGCPCIHNQAQGKEVAEHPGAQIDFVYDKSLWSLRIQRS